MHNYLAAYFALATLLLVPISNASIDGHVFGTIMQTKKSAIRGLITNSIRDSAIMLFRTRPITPSMWGYTIHVSFAYNLSNLALLFDRHTPSHDWYDSLGHKLCIEHMSVSKELKESCRGGNLTPCWCRPMEKLLESCKHHVVPWATTPNGHACDHIAMLCQREPHPFKGLCKYHMSHSKALNTKKNYGGHHNTHQTNPRFKTWKHMHLHSRRHHVNAFMENKVRKSKELQVKHKKWYL